jgi:diacylglycerol O-acyltransferase
MERLRAQDLMMVWPEDRGWAQDIGALVILKSKGQFSIEDARHVVGSRLGCLPRFTQFLDVPGLGRGWPLWVDAPSIDLSHHIQELPLDANADEAQLLRTCEELRLRRFDRSRPLWRMWFLTGVAGGRVALFVKVHHAIADGVAGIGALGTFFDLAPETPHVETPRSRPAPIPSNRDLVGDNLRSKVHRAGEMVRQIAHPTETAKAMRAGWPAVRESFVEGQAPRTSINDGPIGWHRRSGLVRADLDALKATAHSNGAKINDVLMTVVAAGLRDLLLHRGEEVEGVVLRAFVPVSLHEAGADDASGNLDGAMIISLPVGVSDDVERLRLITAETVERKKRSRPQGGTLFRSRPIQKLFVRLAPYQRVMNTYVANVPGPPVPLYFAGTPVSEVFPVVPLLGNVSVGVGALSYASQFNLTAVVDRDRCPDVEVFVDGLRGSLDRLGAIRQTAA